MPQDFIRRQVTDILAYRSLKPVHKVAKLRQLEAEELERRRREVTADNDENLAIIEAALLEISPAIAA